MQAPIDPQVDAQAVDVLRFMARNVQRRPLLHALLTSDIEHWREISPADKPRVFERDVRRFSVACPTLAQKDRVRHAAEGLRLAVQMAS
jgi:hypothetical protein